MKAKATKFDALVLEATKLLVQAMKERHADEIVLDVSEDGSAGLQLFYDREESATVSGKGVAW